MGEVAESEGVSAKGFEAPVNGFGRAVGGVVVEVGRAAAVQGAAELGLSSNPAGRPRRRASMMAASQVLGFSFEMAEDGGSAIKMRIWLGLLSWFVFAMGPRPKAYGGAEKLQASCERAAMCRLQQDNPRPGAAAVVD